MTQNRALEILNSGASIFLTGPPGSGKSYVLEQFVINARRIGKRLAVTATTGIAASLLGGATIHSWSGLGVRQRLEPREIEYLIKDPCLFGRLNEVEILIIDEISMLEAVTLDSLDALLKAARSSFLPFGGIQVVLSGDFFQLPPVSKNPNPYCFLSKSWNEANLLVCYLSEQHRQLPDELTEILTALRDQRFNKYHLALLSARQNIAHPPLTVLMTHNKDVDSLNNQRLAKTSGRSKVYVGQLIGQPQIANDLLRSVLAPKVLTLKVGAQVMFVANDPLKRYVNGSQGRVVGFRHELPVIELKENKSVIVAEAFSWKKEADNRAAELIQIPLKLAWAITIHKCQGMSLDAADIDLKRSFVSGMGYVALSRLKNYKGLYLRSYNSRSLELDRVVYGFDRELRKKSGLNELKSQNYSPRKMAHLLRRAGVKRQIIKQTTGLSDRQLGAILKHE